MEEGLFDFFLNKLKPKKKSEENPSVLLPPRPQPITLGRILPPAERKPRPAIDSLGSTLMFPKVTDQSGVSLRPVFQSLLGINTPSEAQEVSPSVQPASQPHNPQLAGTADQAPGSDGLLPNPDDMVSDYYTRNIAEALAGMSNERRRLQELQDIKNNPVVNNDKGIGGRLFDIFRQFVISAGQAYGASQGPPEARLAEALGAGIAGGAYGGFHPQVDEERKRMYQIQQAQSNIEQYQKQLEDISKGYTQFATGTAGLNKALVEAQKVKAEIEKLQEDMKLARSADQRAEITLQIDSKMKQYDRLVDTINSIISMAKLTGSNTAVNEAVSTLMGRLGLPTTEAPFYGATSPYAREELRQSNALTKVTPDILYTPRTSAQIRNMAASNDTTTITNININDLEDNLAAYLRGQQSQIASGPGGENMKFIREDGTLDMEALGRAATTGLLDINLFKQLMREAGVEVSGKSVNVKKSMTDYINKAVEEERANINDANTLSYYINLLPPDKRVQAVDQAKKVFNLPVGQKRSELVQKMVEAIKNQSRYGANR